jgi:hypothetical protein
VPTSVNRFKKIKKPERGQSSLPPSSPRSPSPCPSKDLGHYTFAGVARSATCVPAVTRSGHCTFAGVGAAAHPPHTIAPSLDPTTTGTDPATSGGSGYQRRIWPPQLPDEEMVEECTLAPGEKRTPAAARRCAATACLVGGGTPLSRLAWLGEGRRCSNQLGWGRGTATAAWEERHRR